MKVKSLLSLTRQFSKKLHKKRLDNRGASLVMVLMVMALIFVLVSIILMITVTNLFMKDAAEKNTKNFYDAESSMDEIRAGLAEVCGKAYAYANDQANSADTTDRSSYYKKAYGKYIYRTLADPSGTEQIIDVPNDVKQRQYKIGSFKTTGGTGISDIRGTNTDYFSDYDGIANCLKGTSVASINKTDSNGNDIGGVVLNSDTDGTNYINYYPNTGEVVLKNVSVQYRDDHDYITKITTDIKLVCPNTEIQETSSLNNILYYTIITDDSLWLKNGSTKTNTLEGNMFAGYNDSQINNFKIKMSHGSVTANGQICYFLSGGNIKLNNQSQLALSDAQMWVKGISLGGNYKNTYTDTSDATDNTANSFTLGANTGKAEDTKLYMQDDLNLYDNSTVSLSGQLFGFGNAEDLLSNEYTGRTVDGRNYHGKSSFAIGQGRVLPSKKKNGANFITIEQDINDHPYEYSSAILLNGKNSSVDLSGLSTISLAGNAYINANPSKTVNSNKDIKTGESISIKPSQRAYLFPAENLEFNANPVSGESFYNNRIIDDIVSHATYTADGKPQHNGTNLPIAVDPDTNQQMRDPDDPTHSHFLIDRSKINVATPEQFITKMDGDTTTETNWRKFQAAGFGKTFEELGVNGIRIAAYQTGHSPVIYMFMHFESDEKANEFFNTYYANVQKKDTLTERLHRYATGGIKLPAGITDFEEDQQYDTDNFYFNGNIVLTNKKNENIFGNDTFTEIKKTSDQAATEREAELLENSGTLYDTYFSMLTDLTTRYDAIPDADLNRTVFDNIIDETKLRNAFKTGVPSGLPGAGSQNKRYYVSDTGRGAILCHNLDSSTAKIDITQADLNNIYQIYKKNYPSATIKDVQINLIVADTDIEISRDFSEYNGLILARGKVIINHDINIKQDATGVIVAMNAVHYLQGSNTQAVEGYTIEQPREIFWNPSAYVVGGMNVTGSPDQAGTVTTTLPSLVTYENWTRE